MPDWTQDKIALSVWTGVAPDALHVIGGLAVMLVAAILLRRPPWHWLPWLAVLVVESVNEVYDLLQTHDPSDEGNLPASLHDMWLTMLWPSVILIVFPWFVRRHARPTPDTDQTPV
ncbi:hypothetical protein ASE75_11795 [Sphingomonas sp. Leaf17]|uniref:hypothetical protein n=1 Tax=Sphingomonas sp. Leaf17 TaxID=1735683 RepID=UPI0006F30D40|nr:hypothetical protein [Sphingomonas sp. Leaf17]KQM63769.1 hypothetical protein ASE75_11795 [Sphingomonas sp. Leaf17]